MRKHFELIKSGTNIDFMKGRNVCLLLSLSLIIFSVCYWVSKGADKYGTDFAGGTEVQVKFDKTVPVANVRSALEKGGFGKAMVQSFEGGTEFAIRSRMESGSDVGKRIRDSLAAVPGVTFNVRKEDYVGPVIGEEIRQKGVRAMFIALLGILVYGSVRFEFRFALGAVLALFHDVIITSGMYVLSGREVSTAFLAAILTIIGYSVNDTVVVYDRVRENMIKREKAKGAGAVPKDRHTAFEEFKLLLNASVNQTLSRTMLTAGATLISVTALWLLASGELSDLAFALFVGIVFGTYSSVFVACYLVLLLERPRKTA